MTGVPDTLTPICPDINLDASNFSEINKKFYPVVNTEHSNSKPILILNVLKIGIWMVWFWNGTTVGAQKIELGKPNAILISKVFTFGFQSSVLSVWKKNYIYHPLIAMVPTIQKQNKPKWLLVKTILFIEFFFIYS